MSRIGAMAAAAALGFWPAVSPAQEGLGRPSVEIVIPKGGLPPGPAVAQPASAGDEPLRTRFSDWPVQRIRFQMPDSPMTLEFSSGILELRKKLTIEARSDSGQSWEGSVDPVERPPQPNAKLFFGTADELAALSQVAHAALPDEAEDLVNGFELRAPGTDVDSLCRRLRLPSTVVFAEAAPTMATALKRCAARGVRVLAIGLEGLVAPDLDPGRGSLWGAGRYGWTPDLDHLAVDILRDLSRNPIGPAEVARKSPSSGDVRTLLEYDPAEETVRETLSVDSDGILWLLGAYVVALAVVGGWGVSRARRSTLLWIAFPATAAIAAGALALVTSATDLEQANLELQLFDVVAPGGDGVETVSLRARARQAQSLEISIPWGDGRLDRFRLEHGLGGPFAATGRDASILEDRIAGTLTLSDLQIARHSSAQIHLTQRIGGGAPYLKSEDGALSIVNPTPHEISHAVLILDGARATVSGVPPRSSKAIELGDTSHDDPFPTWLVKVDSWSPEQRLPPHTYLLATEDEPEALPTVRPAIARHARRVIVTIGPAGPHPAALAADRDGGAAP